jgi:hypothetical protein
MAIADTVVSALSSDNQFPESAAIENTGEWVETTI